MSNRDPYSDPDSLTRNLRSSLRLTGRWYRRIVAACVRLARWGAGQFELAHPEQEGRGVSVDAIDGNRNGMFR